MDTKFHRLECMLYHTNATVDVLAAHLVRMHRMWVLVDESCWRYLHRRPFVSPAIVAIVDRQGTMELPLFRRAAQSRGGKKRGSAKHMKGKKTHVVEKCLQLTSGSRRLASVTCQ